MAKQSIGLFDLETAQALRRMVDGGGAVGEAERIEYPKVVPHYNRVWWATAKEEIGRAEQGTAGTDFEVASGLCYLLHLDREDETLLKEYREDGTTWLEKTVYNPFDSKIKVDTNVVFQVIEDRYGNFWVSERVRYKDWCRFTLDSDLSHSDTYQDATIEAQWGYGFDHPSTSIDVYNMKTHTPSYFVYEGDSGDYGYAQYDPQNDKWWINPTECP